LYYAYLDESGTVTPFKASECFLVIAIVAGTRGISRFLEYQVKKLRRKARIPAGEEIKASLASHRQREKLLLKIASEDIAIIAVILDKRHVYREPEDPEDWYREGASLAVWHCAKRWPDLSLIVDKRYTSAALRSKLEGAIQSKLGELDSARVTIQQIDSRASLGLQAVDFIAWSMAAKYETGDQTYYDLIKSKIIIEELLEAK